MIRQNSQRIVAHINVVLAPRKNRRTAWLGGRMHRLLVVKDLLEVKQRGVVVAGTLDNPGVVRFHIGDAVEIRRAGAPVTRTVISGIGMAPSSGGMANILLSGIATTDIAPGDEVWIVAKTHAE
jgi:hypothetical protein